jgi:chromosome segregation ATPase
MLVLAKTNKSEQDIVGIRGIAERAYREVLDVHALATQAIRRLEDCEKKLQAVDTIQGLQSKFEQMFQLFVSKCDALAKNQEALAKSMQIAREETNATSGKFQEFQKSFYELSNQFEALKSVVKTQFERVFDLHSKCLEKLNKDWHSTVQSLCDRLTITPKQVFDQNEAHNERLSKILESVTLMNEENRKLKIGFRVLENNIDTLRKKGI